MSTSKKKKKEFKIIIKNCLFYKNLEKEREKKDNKKKRKEK